MGTLRPRYAGGGPTRSGVVPAGADPESKGADPLEIVTTAVPIEIIGFYQGIVSYFGAARAAWFWWSILAGALITVLWVAFATQDFGSETPKPKEEIAWRQTILACWAFICWAIGTITPELGEKIGSAWWHPAIGPAALAIGAISLPILDGVLHKLGLPQPRRGSR
jgi:hypothetical protein